MPNSVKLKTFQSWNVTHVYGFDEEIKDGVIMVEKIWCKICRRQLNNIKRDPKIKGVAEKEVETYAKGTSSVTKYAAKRHIESTAHKVGLYFEELDGINSEQESSGSVEPGRTAVGQPRINDVLHRQAEDAYRKLLRTAYFMAEAGRPLTEFKTLVKCQKVNGVRLIDGCDSSHNAREFVSELADAIREKVASILCSSIAFAVLTDGSQPKKTGSEKELVLVRTVRDGVPVYYAIALQDIDEFGAANAENLKKSIDEAFSSKLKLPNERYINVMVSATSDGASVNMGIYNGLLTRFQRERNWLVLVHCISHRLELSLKDAFLKQTQFTRVNDFMTSIYYTMKRSGKLQREFKELGKQSHVQVYSFPKVHGTRFLNHHRKGVNVLLNNWIPLAQCVENAVADTSKRVLQSKLKGYLAKLKDYSFFCTVMLYRELLEIITPLSLKFENGDVAVFDVGLEVEKVQSRLKDTLEENNFSFTDTGNGSFCFRYECNGDVLKCTLPKPNHLRRKLENREFTELHLGGMNRTSDEQVQKQTQKLKECVVPQISACLGKRFESFDCQFYDNMQWLDQANWGVENTTENKEVESIMYLSKHFEATLSYSGFTFCQKTIQREWRDLKMTVQKYYNNFKVKDMWAKIFSHRKGEFPNITKLVEIILCLGPSNSSVERGFSVLTTMLSDKRLSLNHSTMENCLLIKYNHSVWTDKEREEIIEIALQKHMCKKRKVKLSDDETAQAKKQRVGLSYSDTCTSEYENHSGDNLTSSSSEESSESESEPEYHESEPEVSGNENLS